MKEVQVVKLTIDMSVDTNQLRAALASKDADAVAKAIDVPIVPSGRGKYKGPPSSSRLSVDGADYSNMLSALQDATKAAAAGDAMSCFDAQSRLHSALNHNFGSSAGNWLVPALQQTCRNTHRLAVQADEAASIEAGGRNDHSRLQGAVTLLQESFSKTLNDRKEFDPRAPLDENGSKKAGVLFIVNQLFAMYFRLNTLRPCPAGGESGRWRVATCTPLGRWVRWSRTDTSSAGSTCSRTSTMRPRRIWTMPCSTATRMPQATDFDLPRPGQIAAGETSNDASVEKVLAARICAARRGYPHG